MKKEFLQSIKVISLGLVLAFGINFAMAAWTGPTSAPTGNNVDGPITTSDNDKTSNKNQIKYGGVNFGKGVSIGKVTDPNISQNSYLDVNGSTETKGFVNFGMASIYPSDISDSSTDKDLFTVFGTTDSWGKPEFVVDTRSRTTTARNLVAEKNLNVGEIADTPVLFVGEKAYVGDALYVGTTSPSLLSTDANGIKPESYDLFLNGNTNIGVPADGNAGGLCTMTYYDMADPNGPNRTCPYGTYLSRVNINSNNNTATYAECNSFSTKSSLSGSCYNFTEVLSHISYTWNNNSSNECNPQLQMNIGIDKSGAGGLTYSWEAKQDSDDWVKFSDFSNTKNGFEVVGSSTGTCSSSNPSCKIASRSRSGTQRQVALRVTVMDKSKNKSFQQISKNFDRKQICNS